MFVCAARLAVVPTVLLALLVPHVMHAQAADGGRPAEAAALYLR